MGVERQGAKLNWITSFAMIILAGTIYRFKNINKKISKVQMR
jgi:hypothetical protein